MSLVGSILVFLLFVQGGQSLISTLGKTADERNMVVNSIGRKWEFTFTTLVTFGGAFFASFPLFYATSFGGAYWVWFAILVSFVIQAFCSLKLQWWWTTRKKHALPHLPHPQPFENSI